MKYVIVLILIVVIFAVGFFIYNDYFVDNSPNLQETSNVVDFYSSNDEDRKLFDIASKYIVSRVGEECFDENIIPKSIQMEDKDYKFLDGRSGFTNVTITYDFFPIPWSINYSDFSEPIYVYLEDNEVIHTDGMYDLKNPGWCDYSIDEEEALEIIKSNSDSYGYDTDEVADRGIDFKFSNKFSKYSWQFSSCKLNKVLEIDPSDGSVLGYYDHVVCSKNIEDVI